MAPLGSARLTTLPPRRIEHLTPVLRRRPEFEALGARISAARAGFGKRPDEDSVGTTRAFQVRDLLRQDRFYTRVARLAYRSERLSVWVDTLQDATWGPAALAAVVDSLAHYAERGTPTGSIDPGAGLLALLRRHFGEAPDVDGDGRVDALLLDVPDDFLRTGAYVAGFFDPVNLTDDPRSNRRDLVYLDLFPTVFHDGRVRVRDAAATFAHEAQHLIHAGYDADEAPFVNEGLSEFAETLCGFAPRPADAYFDAPGRSLLSWQYDDPLPDYARAALWTRHLFEQTGPAHVRRLVQSPTAGAEAYEEVLRAAHGPTLGALFAAWGEALLAEGPPGDVRDALPDALSLSLPPLSHAFLALPLARTASFEATADDAGVLVSARLARPDGTSTRVPPRPLGGGAHVEGAGSHGSIRLLLTRGAEAAARDTTLGLVVRGEPSGGTRTLLYDDGAPDAFSDHASYLLLGDSAAVGLAFGPGEAVWLSGLSFKGVFQSELQGSGLPAEALRRVVVQVMGFEDGRPSRPLTPPRTFTVRRPFGNLRFEPLDLTGDYGALAALPDSFCVVLRSDPPAGNAVAVAMDRSGTDASVALGPDAAAWQPMRMRRVRGASLAGFAPMIRAHVVRAERIEPLAGGALRVAYDAGGVRLRVDAAEPLDSLRTRAVARTSGGKVAVGRPRFTPDGVVFSFPVEVGGTYAFSVRLADANVGTLRDATLTWTMPERSPFALTSAYPNPTRGHVTLGGLAFEDGTAAFTVFDPLGRRVREVALAPLARGAHALPLDLTDLAPGVYLVRGTFRTGKDVLVHTTTRRVVVL